MKNLIFICCLFFFNFSYAENFCEKEMKSFTKFSSDNKKQYCEDCGFNENVFKQFSDCLFNRVKQFNKNISKNEFYDLPFKELQGLKSLCSVYCYRIENSNGRGSKSTN